MNKRTWICSSSRLWSSGTRRQALLFSGKKNLPLVARLCKLLLSLSLAIKINTTYGNFTPLCFLLLFWRLQSKIAQIPAVKIFWWSNILSSLQSFVIASFYTPCSVKDGGRSLEVRDWWKFFTVHWTGVTRNLQAVRYIFQFLFMWQEIHQGKCETHVLLFTSISYEHKQVSDLSMLVFCFHGHTFVVYLWTTKVHNNSVFKELTLHFLLQKSHLWNSPMPSDFQL